MESHLPREHMHVSRLQILLVHAAENGTRCQTPVEFVLNAHSSIEARCKNAPLRLQVCIRVLLHKLTYNAACHSALH